MSDDTQQKADPAQEQAHDADDVVPVATVASGVLGAFFDELEKTEGLTDKAGKLRALVLGDGVMAEPAIRAILFPDAT
ncbi:hypothetical protein FFK22_018755 [Mycobacterium sp. KBS0706]|uniref:hypothetical protein n=1 Tax=Mycobacterium sp. KBS0706 TaxID=2578109 RepID=UPI00110FDAF9|nr:hypothetical protein [Mycobacterium sp. KBS0706]TSD87092.1 hypothetical protein FFK22_018755 [Mycobacterium sp. KBS0706]